MNIAKAYGLRVSVPEYSFTEDEVEWCKKQAVLLKGLPRNIRGEKVTEYGVLGELAAWRMIGGVWMLNTEDQARYQYDIRSKGKRVEVKTKEAFGNKQLPCRIWDYNAPQDCDFYMFVQVAKDFSRAWVLGYISKCNFYRHADYYSRGQTHSCAGLSSMVMDADSWILDPHVAAQELLIIKSMQC